VRRARRRTRPRSGADRSGSATASAWSHIKAIDVVSDQGAGLRSRAQTDVTELARRLSPAGFSFAFAGDGELLTAPFKSALLGVADVAGEINLAAHRRSNFL
jgi:hypothetical protein